MLTPERYGLSTVQTLAHVASPAPSHGDHLYWKALRTGLRESDAQIERVSSVSGYGDPGVTHFLRSPDGVRFGVGFRPPVGEARGCVVELHGYRPAPISDINRFAAHGLALLQVRVRGFPGSLIDAEELSQNALGWITHQIESPEKWSLTGAALDVATALIAARRAVGGRPVYLRGESFGGGLAIVATSLLADAQPERLAIGLPSLGDWCWRLKSPCHGGAGEEIAQYLLLHPHRENDIVASLLLMDSARHARHVRTPTLCKLAACDEVVPAPSAAAVFNSLGADPGYKRRFTTAFGHFDAGIANARVHNAFDEAVVEFFDPQRTTVEAFAVASQVAEQRIARGRPSEESNFSEPGA